MILHVDRTIDGTAVTYSIDLHDADLTEDDALRIEQTKLGTFTWSIEPTGPFRVPDRDHCGNRGSRSVKRDDPCRFGTIVADDDDWWWVLEPGAERPRRWPRGSWVGIGSPAHLAAVDWQDPELELVLAVHRENPDARGWCHCGESWPCSHAAGEWLGRTSPR